jgi:hypothetical protein
MATAVNLTSMPLSSLKYASNNLDVFQSTGCTDSTFGSQKSDAKSSLLSDSMIKQED